MSGKAPRQKGNRFERSCVNDLQALGLAAERIPLSGSAGGSFTGDVTVPVQGVDRKIECKNRAKGWGDLYGWLPGNYALFIKRDRAETLVVMRLQDFAALSLPLRGDMQ